MPTRCTPAGVFNAVEAAGISVVYAVVVEVWVHRAMTLSDGNVMYLFSSPIAIGLWVAAVAGFIAPMFLRNILRKPQAITD